jgi:pimeloyl-ACP methyl ester carboxylesterase
MARQSSVLKGFNNRGASRAVIFLHGFSGDRDDTWDRFPLLLREARADWDIFTLGYETSFLPDVAGIWSADPDLEVIAKLYLTSLEIDPLAVYRELALVGHSMGGLVVQTALTKSAQLRARAKKIVLFGTPTACARPTCSPSGSGSSTTWPRAVHSSPVCDRIGRSWARTCLSSSWR